MFKPVKSNLESIRDFKKTNKYTPCFLLEKENDITYTKIR